MSSSNVAQTAVAKRARRRSRSLGVAMTEYAFLVTFIAVPTICGFTAGGLMMYSAYVHTRNHILLPTP